jgi:hypothetical protein
MTDEAPLQNPAGGEGFGSVADFTFLPLSLIFFAKSHARSNT